MAKTTPTHYKMNDGVIYCTGHLQNSKPATTDPKAVTCTNCKRGLARLGLAA